MIKLSKDIVTQFLASRQHGCGGYCQCEDCVAWLAAKIEEVTAPVEVEVVKLQADLAASNAAAVQVHKDLEAEISKLAELKSWCRRLSR